MELLKCQSIEIFLFCASQCVNITAELLKVFEMLERHKHEFKNEAWHMLDVKKVCQLNKLSTFTVKYTLVVKYTQNYAKMPVLVR